MSASTVNLVFLSLLGLTCCLWAVEDQKDDAETNNGEDVTRPLSRFDVRYQFKNISHSDSNDNIVTLRADRPVPLSRSWSLATRLDLPIYQTDAVSNDNPNGDSVIGLGDLLIQLVLVDTIRDDFAVGAGTQLVFPTASDDSMGNGKYRLVPTIGARWSLRQINATTWATALLRWNVSVAGDSNRRDISELQFAPQFNYGLPREWYVILYPSSDIRYNLKPVPASDSGRWFVPFDMAVGKKMDPRTVLSMEASVPIVNQYHVYDFKFEFRAGFFF